MADAEAPAAAPEKKAGGKKGFMVTAVLLLVEAVVIVGAMMMVGGPAPVEAKEMLDHVTPEEEMVVEVQALEDRLSNDKMGMTYIYPTEIYVQVKQKHAEHIEAELEQFRNEIRSEIGAIWKTAEPTHFQEPKMESLTRRVEALLKERFEKDAHAKEPVVLKVVIVSGTGFRVDN